MCLIKSIVFISSMLQQNRKIKKLAVFSKSILKQQLVKKTLPFFNNKFLVKSNFLSEATFLLTFNCNLKCIMCPQWGEAGICKNKKFKELTLTQWYNIIEQLKNNGVKSIFLTGGEPLLYQNWQKIAEYIKSKQITTNLITNGLLLKNNFESVVNYIDNLHLSLYLMPDKNNLSKVKIILQGINSVNKIKKHKNKFIPFINLVFTINSENYKYLYSLIKYYQQNIYSFDEIIIQHLLFLRKEQLLKQQIFMKNNFSQDIWALNGFGLKGVNNIDIEVLFSQINKIKQDKTLNKLTVFKPDLNNFKDLKKYYNGIIPDKYKNKTCFAPWWQTIILSDGTLWLCPDIKIGDLTKTSLNNLLKNERATKLKNIILKYKQLSSCSGCCYLYE